MKIRGGLPVHDGLVVKCLTLTLADLQPMPQRELRDDFKCREGWMAPDLTWRGVLLRSVLALASPLPEGRYVHASAGDFSSFSHRRRSRRWVREEALAGGRIIRI
jgi:DMSO/TMAO reductase YedYZ molybdopterin-dependent catalytic subunit